MSCIWHSWHVQDLRHKTIGVPSASTVHYQLLYLLNQIFNISHEVNVINVNPDGLRQAWEAGEIDGYACPRWSVHLCVCPSFLQMVCPSLSVFIVLACQDLSCLSSCLAPGPLSGRRTFSICKKTQTFEAVNGWTLA